MNQTEKIESKVIRRTKALLIAILVIVLGHTSIFAQNASSQLQPLKDKADDLLSANQIVPALDIYHQIIEKEPEFSNCYFNMAICYNQLKQFDKAYAALEKFVTLKPNDSEAFFNMGIMQVYLGNERIARTHLHKAQALHPSREISKRIKNALDHLQPSPFSEESLATAQAILNQSAQN